MIGYMKISDAAKKWELSEPTVNGLCAQGRIPNVMKSGTTWPTAEDAEKAKDNRIKSAKYKKKP